jgi:hypothetical protein
MNRSSVFACVAVLALSACGGHGGGGALPPASPVTSITKAPAKGTRATLSVIVPHPVTGSQARRPAYVSPSSAQLLVAVNSGTPTTYGLSPQSPGCATVQGNIQCIFQIAAAAGNDSFALTLEDAAGAVLSTNVVGAKLAAGVVTPVNVTLAGIPAAVLAVPGVGSGIEGSATPAWHVPGLFAEPVELEALDADGNVIIGPGAPTIAAPSVSVGGSFATIVSANSGDPNAYMLKPTGAASGGQTVTVSASAQSIALSNGTQSTPVASSTNFLYTPAIAAASGADLNEFSLETGNLIGSLAINPGVTIAFGAANDAIGDVWVEFSSFGGASVGDFVALFPPGATAPTTVLNAGGFGNIATGPKNMLYVVNQEDGSTFAHNLVLPRVAEYAQGVASGASPTYLITDPSGTNLTNPVAVGVDGSGNVYVANSDTGLIPVYAKGNQTAPTLTVSEGGTPAAMAVDQAGDIYVYDSTSQCIVFIAAGQTSPTAILGNFPNFEFDMMFDPAGDLLVGMNTGIQVFAASGLSGSANVTTTLTGDTGAPAWVP